MYEKEFPVIDVRATGWNIGRLRRERGLTVRDVQRFFGFDGSRAIYNREEGKSLPKLDHLLALSVLLDVTVEDILVSVER